MRLLPLNTKLQAGQYFTHQLWLNRKVLIVFQVLTDIDRAVIYLKQSDSGDPFNINDKQIMVDQIKISYYENDILILDKNDIDLLKLEFL